MGLAVLVLPVTVVAAAAAEVSDEADLRAAFGSASTSEIMLESSVEFHRRVRQVAGRTDPAGGPCGLGPPTIRARALVVGDGRPLRDHRLHGTVGAREPEAAMATIEARTDDLTTIEVDAVVNAANEQLHHGGGVAAALAEAGGPSVQAESDDWVDEHGEVEIGSAAVTTAGDLPAGCIVHVVGPRYAGDGEDAARLASSVTAALDTAVERDATSIALPAISAGIFGYPMADATRVIVRACRSWVTANPDTDLDIVLVGVNDNVTGAFQTALDDDLPA